MNKKESSYRSIVPLDLGQYIKPVIPGAPAFLIRAVWYLTNVLLFKNAILGLVPSSLQAKVLRLFGAHIGKGLVCRPGLSIKSPWFLEVGDDVWLGENVWIDNLCSVRIGSNCCISQGVYIFTGNHDWSKPTFDYFSNPIAIGEGVWVAAFATVYPGDDIPPHVVVQTQR